MKRVSIYLLLALPLFALDVKQGIEDGYSQYKSEACDKAKEKAYEKHNILNMDVGCTCEKDDSHQWLCMIKYEYVEEKQPYE